MNDDTISRRAAIKAICEHGTELERRGITVLAVANHKQVTVDLLENLPAAERRGRWVKGDEMADYPRVPYKSWETYCSCCGAIKEQSNDGFCGNCGARMEASE